MALGLPGGAPQKSNDPASRLPQDAHPDQAAQCTVPDTVVAGKADPDPAGRGCPMTASPDGRPVPGSAGWVRAERPGSVPPDAAGGHLSGPTRPLSCTREPQITRRAECRPRRRGPQ
ncbi:Hypothetical predicted protein [Marmota monax]|uniref:Uncharacterized protein n=1 Tax=Marmota monax TaxID=9995 RepID=A0A5E4A3W1_MARMO|nr:hypothetical protein GHT09_005962 [Marmota monax]VTJ51930.1 Hypothetical predicted protein [Marmota monax]